MTSNLQNLVFSLVEFLKKIKQETNLINWICTRYSILHHKITSDLGKNLRQDPVSHPMTNPLFKTTRTFLNFFCCSLLINSLINQLILLKIIKKEQKLFTISERDPCQILDHIEEPGTIGNAFLSNTRSFLNSHYHFHMIRYHH